MKAIVRDRFGSPDVLQSRARGNIAIETLYVPAT